MISRKAFGLPKILVLAISMGLLIGMASPVRAGGCSAVWPCGEVENNDSNDAIAVITNWCGAKHHNDLIGDPPCRSNAGHVVYVFPGERVGGGSIDIDGFRASSRCKTTLSGIGGGPYDRMKQWKSHWKKIGDATTATISQVDCADGMSCAAGDNPYPSRNIGGNRSVRSVRHNETLSQLRYNGTTRCAWALVAYPRSGDTFWVDRSVDGGHHWQQLDIVWNNEFFWQAPNLWWSPKFTLARNDAGSLMRACGNIGGGTQCTGWF